MVKILTIAGSDCSGGAGIQADLKTMAAHGAYGMSVITALTAQNTTGVYGVLDADPAFVAKQIDCVFEDIRPDAVKIGMVSQAAIIEAIAERLTHYRVQNLVVDPVMISTSGSRLLSPDAMDALVAKLLPMADLITPNIPEAEVLWGHPIHSAADMEAAAQAIHQAIGSAVLLKGGHDIHTANDLLCTRDGSLWIEGVRIDNPNSHGTGCTLSSAIACGLGKGEALEDAVRHAKAYISGALGAMLDLGSGSGPLDHMWVLGKEEK